MKMMLDVNVRKGSSKIQSLKPTGFRFNHPCSFPFAFLLILHLFKIHFASFCLQGLFTINRSFVGSGRKPSHLLASPSNFSPEVGSTGFRSDAVCTTIPDARGDNIWPCTPVTPLHRTAGRVETLLGIFCHQKRHLSGIFFGKMMVSLPLVVGGAIGLAWKVIRVATFDHFDPLVMCANGL